VFSGRKGGIGISGIWTSGSNSSLRFASISAYSSAVSSGSVISITPVPGSTLDSFVSILPWSTIKASSSSSYSWTWFSSSLVWEKLCLGGGDSSVFLGDSGSGYSSTKSSSLIWISPSPGSGDSGVWEASIWSDWERLKSRVSTLWWSKVSVWGSDSSVLRGSSNKGSWSFCWIYSDSSMLFLGDSSSVLIGSDNSVSIPGSLSSVSKGSNLGGEGIGICWSNEVSNL